jgi:two-component system response regulator PilR (NtrC family)
MSTILIVDDEPSMCTMLGIMLRKEGYEIFTAGDRAQAASVLARSVIDLVITDVKLPDGDGLEILRHVRAGSASTPVIVMTAYGSTETAVAALKLGAADYLIKPFDLDELRIVVRNSLEHTQLQEENLRLKAELRARHGVAGVIAVSRAMAAVLETARSVAATSSTVLLTGESGTGKEVVAKVVHTLSPRAQAPFVTVNCGAIPDTLFESELFGHMKGAFTDARQDRKGLFESAHKGTLFLDEVGEIAPAMQVKLLRALQERKIRRVGASQELPVDVRVIAATNRSLEAMVEDGRFRQDLYYRLNVIPLHLPPLRERREDVPVLAEHFRERFAREMGKDVRSISTAAMEQLTRYAWPGNVRELENAIERAIALESTPSILPERLPERVWAAPPAASAAPPPASPAAPDELGPGFSLDAFLNGIEARLVREALTRTTGDRAAASALLGITPRSLRYLLVKHGGALGRDKN